MLWGGRSRRNRKNRINKHYIRKEIQPLRRSTRIKRPVDVYQAGLPAIITVILLLLPGVLSLADVTSRCYLGKRTQTIKIFFVVKKSVAVWFTHRCLTPCSVHIRPVGMMRIYRISPLQRGCECSKVIGSMVRRSFCEISKTTFLRCAVSKGGHT